MDATILHALINKRGKAASSPLDASFAMHPTLKSLICWQVAPRFKLAQHLLALVPTVVRFAEEDAVDLRSEANNHID